MHPLIIFCLDSIFPPSSEARLVRTLSSSDVLNLYTKTLVHSVIALSEYTHPHIRALIHEAKFHGNKKAFSLLNALLQKYLSTTTSPVDMIIPIPLSRARMRTRGYNQVISILTVHPLPAQPTIQTNMLRRVRDTRPQTELTRDERLTNLRDAFGVADGTHITGKHILLIDDVMTTGTTLKTAKATLLQFHPASVTCLALTH